MSTKIEELRKKKAALLEAEQKAREAAEEVALELELATIEKHGPRGKRWEMLTSTLGPVVVVRGDGLHFKKLSNVLSDETKTAPEISIAYREFVLAQVEFPERSAAEVIFNELPGLVVRCQDALIVLHRGEETTATGKR